MVLLEAMLAGLPIVATRMSAVPEVVADDVTGLLVEPGDVTGLSAALSRLLNDPERAAALGRAGRERARTSFSIARMVAGTTAVYGAATAPSSGSTPGRQGAQGG
jgi:starch synthase